MKANILILILLGASFHLAAQESSAPLSVPSSDMRYQKRLHIDVGVGANIDLAGSSDNTLAALLGTRHKVVPAFDVRVAHLFAPRFGWYADMRFKIFKSRFEDASRLEELLDEFLDKVFPGIYQFANHLHFAYNLGGVYRLEGKKWQCYPRVGIGQSTYGMNRKKSKGRKEKVISLKTDGTTLCLNFGVSTQYRLSPMSYLTLDVLYQHPLNKTEAYLSSSPEGEPKQEFSYSGRTLGRELNISLGISVQVDIKKKKK